MKVLVTVKCPECKVPMEFDFDISEHIAYNPSFCDACLRTFTPLQELNIYEEAEKQANSNLIDRADYLKE